MRRIEQITESHSFTDIVTDSYQKAVNSCDILLKNLKDSNSVINSERLLQILLFQIDLYATHANPDVLKSVETLMEYYYKNSQKSNDDYSFGTGKLGFLYAATRLYNIKKTTHFLDKAISLIEERINNFIISPYTNNSIYTGRAGSFLVLNYYYNVTNDVKVKPWIEAIAQKIVTQAHFSDKGIYWKDHIEKLYGLLNFEYGNAGIGYLFLALGNLYKNDDFHVLAKQIYNHQCQFWDADLGWKASKKGIHSVTTYKEAIAAIKEKNNAFFEPLLNNLFIHVGVTKFTLHLWQTLKENSVKTEAITYLTVCKQLFLNSKTEITIEKALMVGSLFIEAAKVFNDKQYLIEAKKIADFIQKRNLSETSDNFSTCILKTKIAHFYLALENPLINNSLVPKYNALKEKTKKSLPVEVKESLLQNTFHRTVTLLKSIDNELLNEYLAQPIKDKAVFDFMLFIKKKLNRFSPIQKKQLSEILKLEISSYNLKKEIQNYAHLEAKNIHTYQTVQEVFNKPTEELLREVLQINPNAKMIPTAWNWELKQGVFSIDTIQNTESKANMFLLPYYKNLVTEYWQNPYNVILNYFESQTQISEAIAHTKQFYLSKDAFFIDSFSQFVMAETTYVLQHLDTIILNIIKEYMGIGLLEIVPNTTKFS